MCQYRLVSVLLANAAELCPERAGSSQNAIREPALHEEAVKVLPAGTHAQFWPTSLRSTFVRSDGAVLTDADGHEYVDLLGDYTAGLLDSEGACSTPRGTR